jgi:hypothetical protein
MDEPGFGARFVADNPGVRFLKAFVIDVNGSRAASGYLVLSRRFVRPASDVDRRIS